MGGGGGFRPISMHPRGKKTPRWSISCSALKRTAVSTRVIQLHTTQGERGGHHTTTEGWREGYFIQWETENITQQEKREHHTQQRKRKHHTTPKELHTTEEEKTSHNRG